MSKIDYGSVMSRAAQTGLVFALMASVSAPVQALPQLDGLDLEQMSVRELMRLDTEQALNLSRARAPVPGRTIDPPTRTARSMLGDPSLSAIYGVGKHLMAEVVIDHVIYLYRHGQALPVGVAPGDDVLLLKNINATCVDLKNAERNHHLCLRPAQWVGK